MAQVREWDADEVERTVFKNFLDSFQLRFVYQERFYDYPMAYVEDLRQRVQSNWEGFCRSHATVVEIIERQRVQSDALHIDDNYEQEMQDTALVYEEAKRMLDGRLTELRRGDVPLPVPVPSIPRASEVTLPSFSGDFTEFTAFQAAYKARVQYETYPPHAKIDIILRALTGDAKRHLGPVRGQDANELQRIWQHLESTYFNKYLLQRAHIGAIYDQPPLSAESAAGYRAMIGRLTQNMHALTELDIPTENMDPPILEMVLRRLDPQGTHYWETTRDRDHLPTVNSFVSFLEQRIIVLQNTAIQAKRIEPKAEVRAEPADHRGANHSDKRSGHSNGSNSGHKRQSSDSHGSTGTKRHRDGENRGNKTDYDGRPKAPTTCLMNCNYHRPHQLWLCNQFRALELEQRIQFIDKHKLCRRCLTLKHPIDQCRSPKCNDCTGEPHNLVLCPKYMVVARANTARPSKGRNGRRGKSNPFASSQ